MQPMFSIVMPTRNRCELLRQALRSALRQTMDDFEIVVVMNQCVDGTAEVAQSFADARIRIVSTPGPMFMHDSWQFALSQVRGRYLGYLCDDDALHPRALELASRVIEGAGADVVYWPMAYWCEGPEQGARERASFRFGAAYSDHLLEVDRAALIDAAYELRATFNEFVPRMLNSIVCADLVKRAATAGTRLFRPSCPDYSSMIATAVHARRMICIDAPLMVAGLTPQSIGTSAMQRGEAARAFYRGLLRDEPSLIRLPILLAIRCWIGQTYAQCAAEIDRLRGRAVNLVHLFGWAWTEIQQWKRQGCDVAKVELEWATALAEQPPGVRQQIEQFVVDRRSIETQSFVSCVRQSGPMLGCGPTAAPGGVAREDGFRTIDEFAAGLDTWIATRGASLADVWRRTSDLAGGRAPVLYGMGNVGQALVRAAGIANTSVRHTILAVDDGADRFPCDCTPLESSGQLHPSRHFAIVTPEHHDSIRRQLEQRGFAHRRDWMTLDELIEHLRDQGAEMSEGRRTRTACGPPSALA